MEDVQPHMSEAGVLLIDPKYPQNVGGALRACAIFDAPTLRWTGERVTGYKSVANYSRQGNYRKQRLPREERMKDYQLVDWRRSYAYPRPLEAPVFDRLTPVAVEFRENSELLPDFVHPENAVYVFGPEDGSLDKGMLAACHRFVKIPSKHCLNLAAAVNVVLYDRMVKLGRC